MDTLLFYFPQSSYCKAFRGVAECYAFSCFYDHVGLRDLPAIRHIKGTNAVIVNNDALVGNAVLLFGVVHLKVVNQLRGYDRLNSRFTTCLYRITFRISALALSLFTFLCYN